MMHPSDSDTTMFRTVRDGQGAPVTCATCGCRLEHATTSEPGSWYHFGRFAGRDARGCRVLCIELAHDAQGLSATAVPA